LRGSYGGEYVIEQNVHGYYELLAPLLELFQTKKRHSISTEPYVFYHTEKNKLLLETNMTTMLARSANYVARWKAFLLDKRLHEWVELPGLSDSKKLLYNKKLSKPKRISVLCDDQSGLSAFMLINSVAHLPHVTIYGVASSAKADFLMYRMMDSPDGRLFLSFPLAMRKKLLHDEKSLPPVTPLPNGIKYHQAYDYIISLSSLKE
jgi:hypothetical protein